MTAVASTSSGTGATAEGASSTCAAGARGEQGSHAQGVLQCGAQGRGAAGLTGAHLASRAEPGLRDHAQDDHCRAEKKLLSLPAVEEILSAARAGGVLELDEA